MRENLGEIIFHSTISSSLISGARDAYKEANSLKVYLNQGLKLANRHFLICVLYGKSQGCESDCKAWTENPHPSCPQQHCSTPFHSPSPHMQAPFSWKALFPCPHFKTAPRDIFLSSSLAFCISRVHLL